MKFQVHITEDAEQDLDGIYSYVHKMILNQKQTASS